MAGTTDTTEQARGSMATQGRLWAERARDWAEVMEGWNGWGIPLYRQILEQRLGAPGIDHEPPSAIGQHPREGEPEAPRCTGDQCGLHGPSRYARDRRAPIGNWD